MSDLLLGSIQYGGYISIVKFAVFAVLFFIWLPVVGWVAKDARMVGTKDIFWTAIVFAAGAIAAMLWLLIPIFFVGLPLFLIAAVVPTVLYMMHRDKKVPDSQRILTRQFFKIMFSKKEGEKEEEPEKEKEEKEEQKSEEEKKSTERRQEEVVASDELRFVNSHSNTLPKPEAGTPEFRTYKIAFVILEDCIWRRAAEIIFAPAPPNYNVVYYIDGAPLKQPELPRQQVEQFIGFIKGLAGLNANERRKPQKGRFRARRGELNTEWEVTTAGSTAGEQLKLKQIMQRQISRLPDIGLTPEHLEQFNKVHQLKQGLFLVTGLKKTGMTSTFYSLIKEHDPYLNVITTLERQPSEELPSVTQNIFTLSDSSTTTYAKKLQALLKLRCDVIGVTDCGDTETAKIICNTAKEKLVYVAFEAENVIKALGRWAKLVGEKNLAVESLVGITNQRLLRKLCEQCKEAYEPNKDMLRKFNIPAEKVKVLYRAGKPKTDKKGKPVICPVCQGTGFMGRLPIFEVITINGDLREFIKNSKSLAEIGGEFRKAKMRYLQEQGLKQVIAGTTAITEIVRVLSIGEQPEKKPAPET